MIDPVRDYLNQIARYPLLTAQQEIQLSRQVQDMLAIINTNAQHGLNEQRVIKRGRKARNTLINCNLRLVVYIAKKYAKRLNGNSMELLDLIQEGSFGLQRAVEKFDPSRGYKFSTYSYWWIKQAIGRAIDTQEKIIRLPSHKLDQIYAAIKYRNECVKTEGGASIAAMAAHIGVTTEEMSLLLNRYVATRSLDEMCAGGDGETPLLEMLADDRSVDEEVQQAIREEQVQLAFFRLNEDDRYVLAERYGLRDYCPKTFHVIASQRGVCREKIRKDLRIAEHRMRVQLIMQGLAA